MDHPAAVRLAQQATAGDSVLLLGRAVLASEERVESLAGRRLSLFMLQDDLKVYGVSSVPAAVQIIDFPGWVDLAATCKTQQVWR